MPIELVAAPQFEASLRCQVYLWHGTPVRQGLAIAQDDFKVSFAGSGNGSMFGEGFWKVFLEPCDNPTQTNTAYIYIRYCLSMSL